MNNKNLAKTGEFLDKMLTCFLKLCGYYSIVRFFWSSALFRRSGFPSVRSRVVRFQRCHPSEVDFQSIATIYLKALGVEESNVHFNQGTVHFIHFESESSLLSFRFFRDLFLHIFSLLLSHHISFHFQVIEGGILIKTNGNRRLTLDRREFHLILKKVITLGMEERRLMQLDSINPGADHFTHILLLLPCIIALGSSAQQLEFCLITSSIDVEGKE